MRSDDLVQPLRRGINFGNALDAGRDDRPRLQLRECHFDAVVDAGFDLLRLPVRWSAHADESAPYRIDPTFFERVDWAIASGLRRDLAIVVNVHHYHELQSTPHEHGARFLALWRQIAARYADRSERLYFELLNEPRDALTPAIWNELLPRALAVVRQSNPGRFVIVGSGRMNDLDALAELKLPHDERLIATIHYYAPFEFTHQGAAWVAGSDQWLGSVWGDEADRAAVRRDLERAAAWANEHSVRLFVGEFGTHERADAASRLRWTGFVRSEAHRLGMCWCYWDFGTDFGAFDVRRNAWRTPIRDALLPPAPPTAED